MNRFTNKAAAQNSDYIKKTPEVIRSEGNHLKNQKSAYLHQHAYNPVDWYPWSEESLARAKKEDKPIFLSIGYSSCHWCHVMEEEVFTKDDIAAFLNDHFISIKVDREERPDLDAVYMDVVQAMTGRGGWPLTVFLTPDLVPFFGGTYFPPDQFVDLIAAIKRAYSDDRSKIDELTSRIKETFAQMPTFSSDNELKPAMLENIVSETKKMFDNKWGGFDNQMKFPTPVRWMFLLHHYRKTGDKQLGDMIKKTLDLMGSGGIHDHIGGGFHRYTIEPTWLIPHFEKMLYDNAQLASLYIEASVVFDNPRYAEIARSILDFMIENMSDKKSGFYSSYDADSEGEEGLFYLWTYDEIVSLAGNDDGPPLAMLLGVSQSGNFEGENIITRRIKPMEVALKFNKDVTDIERLYKRYQGEMRSYRASRIMPGLDKKIITSWNGLAIAAMAQGYVVFNDEKYRKAAEDAADYIWRIHHRENGDLYRSSYNGEAGNEGILDDYAFLASGLIELYMITGEIQHYKKALELIDYVQVHFKYPEAGYYLTSDGYEAPLGRRIEYFDSVRPSGNSMMMQVLLKMASLSGDNSMYKELRNTLNAFSEKMKNASLEMACWWDTAEKLNGPFYEVVIVGDPDQISTRKMVSTYWQIYPSHAVLVNLTATGRESEIANLFPLVSGKNTINEKATAYVCQFGTCKFPTNDPETMKAQIIEGWTF